MAEFFKNVFAIVKSTVTNFMWYDVLDILIVTIILYYVLKFIRDTRAAQLAKGIVVVIVAFQLAKLLRLTATTYILNSTVEFGILAVIIVFQPELRSALERLGRRGMFSKLPFFNGEHEVDGQLEMNDVEEIVKAVTDMASTRTGALLILERETRLGEVCNTGTRVDSLITSEMIRSLFFHNSALHDGAVIVRGNRIEAAGCVLPLTHQDVDSALGTRHRAGIGVTEVSDAVAIIVSEETGIVSVATEGNLNRRVTPDTLRGLLIREMKLTKEQEKPSFVQRLKGKKKDEN